MTADQTVTLNIKDKTYKAFIRNGAVTQIHSVGGKALAYVSVEGVNGKKIAKLALAQAV